MAKPPRGDYNPWQREHIQQEIEMQGGRRKIAIALVNNEYEGAPTPIFCVHPLCMGRMFYKATIGAMKCTACGRLATSQGKLI